MIGTLQKLKAVFSSRHRDARAKGEENAADVAKDDTDSVAESAGHSSKDAARKALEKYDLSDPGTVELLLDDGEDDNSDDGELTRAQQLQKVQETLISVEISAQKGVELKGDRIRVPGRAPLSVFTLLQLLLATFGFAAGIIHFSMMAPNFLIAQLVIYFMLVVQTIIYHSSYRAMRIAMTAIQTLATFGIMALVGWAFYDLVAHPLPGVQHHFLLKTALASFAGVPLLMLAHLTYFGRGYRFIEIKRK